MSRPKIEAYRESYEDDQVTPLLRRENPSRYPTCEEALDDQETTDLRRISVRVPQPTLLVINGLEAGRLEIVTDELVVGRGEECGLRLPDPGVSRLHVRLLRAGAEVVLEDLGSRNGTFVDGAPLEGKKLLPSSSHVTLGSVSLRYALLGADEQQLAQELYDASRRDALTRAFNRRYFFARFQGALSFARRQNKPTSLLVFDFDHFKRINDEHGHPGGDAVLQRATWAVRGVLRSEDVLGRLGGEEFAVLLGGASRTEALACAERVRRAVANLPIPFEGKTIGASVSVGVASTDESVLDAQALYRLADTRLYAAKRQGRDRVVGS